ncbi:MAG: hypothetical protein OEV33_03495 [Armatimonadota bacterium]|nr:hypothetical protein [Armatimonadota bacterium]
MTRILATISLLGLVLVWGVACAQTPGVSPTDYVGLVEALRDEGVTAEPAGMVSQPFFSVEGQAITVNGEQVQVFEFADAAAAEAAAALVSEDGSAVGTNMISWIAPPHFYQHGRLVVLYVGDQTAIQSALESVLGEQFAGR